MINPRLKPTTPNPTESSNEKDEVDPRQENLEAFVATRIVNNVRTSFQILYEN